MSNNDYWIPEDDWKVVVDSVPLVSADLIIKYEGGILP